MSLSSSPPKLARGSPGARPSISSSPANYRFIPTVDIDSAFAYLQRGLARTLGAYLKSALRADLKEIVHRTRTLTGRERDRFDNFSFLFDAHDSRDLHPYYFIHLGKYGRFDKSISPVKPRFRSIVRDISNRYKVGLHPSYRSNKDIDTLVKEKHLLEEITGEITTISRQHYLYLSFPETYRRLTDIGIREDYSMGFSGFMGFRAGTCHPFPFYNLVDEKETSLIVHSFQVMDACVNNNYENPMLANEEIHEMKSLVKKYGGEFISIVHNELYQENDEGEKWRYWYNNLLDDAR